MYVILQRGEKLNHARDLAIGTNRGAAYSMSFSIKLASAVGINPQSRTYQFMSMADATLREHEALHVALQ